MRAVEC